MLLFPAEALPNLARRARARRTRSLAVTQCRNLGRRYREDLTNAKKLGCTTFRFSIEWARIEPKRGFIDEQAVKRYNQMLVRAGGVPRTH